MCGQKRVLRVNEKNDTTNVGELYAGTSVAVAIQNEENYMLLNKVKGKQQLLKRKKRVTEQIIHCKCNLN